MLLAILWGQIWLLELLQFCHNGQDKSAYTNGHSMAKTCRGWRQLVVLGEKPKEVVMVVTCTTFHSLDASY